MTATVPPHRTLPRWQRSLLPAVLGADPGEADRSSLPRSLRDWIVDICLFGLAVIVGVATIASYHPWDRTWLLIADVVLGVPSCLGLWVRRRHSLILGYATACASAVSGLAGGAAAVALFTVAIHCSPRRMLQLMGVNVASVAVFAAVYPHDGHYRFSELWVGLTFIVIVVCMGSLVRVRRQLVLSLHERNRRLEEEQHLRVREAQQAERARIAREMHDVLAHRISLLSLHAGALEFRPDASPEEIAKAAAVIRVSARAAQEELREVIGVLRTESGDEAVQPPQPTIADVSMLVQESRRAGMDVRLDTALEADSLPPTLGRTVYRLVQEAVTNARKHAPGHVVSIKISGYPRVGVSVSVVDRPVVGHADDAGSTARVVTDAPTQPDELLGSGTGLIGLGERVALVGGELHHGPLPGGGYEVRATLPWTGEDAP